MLADLAAVRVAGPPPMREALVRPAKASAAAAALGLAAQIPEAAAAAVQVKREHKDRSVRAVTVATVSNGPLAPATTTEAVAVVAWMLA